MPGNAPYQLIGGTNFDSEKLIAYEIGYRVRPATNLSLSLATYYKHYDDIRSVEVVNNSYVIGNAWHFAFATFLIANAAFAQVSREFQVKAVFLFNFAQFAEWPVEAFAAKDSPLVIGVLGKDPFGAALDGTVNGESVRGHRLVVERYRTVEEIRACHILYISTSESNRLDHILEKLDKKPILTVSEIPGSAPRGVMIRFVTESNKIRLRINAEAVKGARLSLSSKLLRAAEIVTTKKK